MHLLLIEDDPVLANGLMHTLQSANFTVTHEANGERADHLLTVKHYDLVILDLGLPDMDGSEVLLRLRQRGSDVPVLVLTARNSLSDRVLGLDCGADDYLAKPFDLRELEARIRALLRRRQSVAQLQVGELCLDTVGQRATLQGEPVELLARELSVLKILMLRVGRVVSKEQLCEQVSSLGEEVSINAVEVYVHRLRKKLESGGINIRTLRGLGYMLETP
ncbi:MAG: response regulator transcription factor [Gallionella sp.]|jgi:DNA-binding response OmpR family regulator